MRQRKGCDLRDECPFAAGCVVEDSGECELNDVQRKDSSDILDDDDIPMILSPVFDDEEEPYFLEEELE